MKCPNCQKTILLIFAVFALIIFGAATVMAGSYVVEKVWSDKILVNSGYSQYIIDYSWDCFSSDFLEGDTIYIDDYGIPSYGDKIITQGYITESVCEVFNVEEVNLKKYFVEKVIDGDDKIIATNSKGTTFLVEYGMGCLSMWNYEGRSIDIDVGGAFLNGIGDRIYLFDSGDDCKVWDAEKLSGNYSGDTRGSFRGGTYDSEAAKDLLRGLIEESCPANSTLQGDSCVCDEGYAVSGGRCITLTQSCQNQYGSNVSYNSSKDACQCHSGYVLNDPKTRCITGDSWCQSKFGQHSAFNSNDKRCYCKSGYSFQNSECVKQVVCPANSTRQGNECICNEGYVKQGGSCIVPQQYCNNEYEGEVVGFVDNAGNVTCECDSGYNWGPKGEKCIKQKNPELSTKDVQEVQEQSADVTLEPATSSKARQALSDDIQQSKVRDTGANFQKKNSEGSEQSVSSLLANIWSAIKGLFGRIFP